MSNDDPHASGPALVAGRDLHKAYRMGSRAVEVLRGVSLEVPRGAFLALRGASGAGKSTLLHLLGGLDTPTAGDVLVDGRSLAVMSAKELAVFRNRRIGFVFQAYHLLPELDALENVGLPARIARVPATEASRRAAQLLRRVGLEHRLDHRPGELSGGEQQRVAIARALVNAPNLILADEPTGNLDTHTGDGIIDLLCDLQAEHQATLIIATHDSRVAARVPHAIELEDGRLISG
ncbi:MAG: ABC transporter ATP-binding protein [Verrucomicrobia bacterium]|nr:ABC transporter ATP-binding protein [Verrucomicrobiota bacterium]OQC65953.1 MAG: Lipoprotein-releasing system ATP-binding protein LolD [Verrucomicrobia bacterium ADurb.Bin006]MDI9379279.1 ABC transporter ATP-binding protein [Verrucomicrobiota bacterium]NMD20194.1 ABC transporter ATP-binding protein [Verrucomicrobiota bacterium]HNV00080.1 ABC transporter ATP-binding protein [Verrucomicrobiota bacterium]